MGYRVIPSYINPTLPRGELFTDLSVPTSKNKLGTILKSYRVDFNIIVKNIHQS